MNYIGYTICVNYKIYVELKIIQSTLNTRNRHDRINAGRLMN